MTSKQAPIWHSSSYSGSNNNCIEHAQLPNGRQAIRDTKDPERRTTLLFEAAAWSHFVNGLSGSAQGA